MKFLIFIGSMILLFLSCKRAEHGHPFYPKELTIRESGYDYNSWIKENNVTNNITPDYFFPTSIITNPNGMITLLNVSEIYYGKLPDDTTYIRWSKEIYFFKEDSMFINRHHYTQLSGEWNEILFFGIGSRYALNHKWCYYTYNRKQTIDNFDFAEGNHDFYSFRAAIREQSPLWDYPRDTVAFLNFQASYR